MQYIKTLENKKHFDVIVCGAGPSGISAALTAARAGLSVALFERYGVVGGNLTVGNVTTIMGEVGEGTIAEEIMTLLQAPDGGTAIDPENAKLALTGLLDLENLSLFLQCPVIDTFLEDKVVKGIIAATQEGPALFSASCIIDATGDGYVAAISGAQVMKGRDIDQLLQPVSLLYHIDGVDPACKLVCRHEEDDTILSKGKSYLNLCQEAAKIGLLPPNVTIVRLYPTNVAGEYLVNATQDNGIDVTLSSDVAKAEFELRRQIEMVNKFLQTQIPGFQNIRIRISGSTLGVRESRRILGKYLLHDDDLLQGKRFDDVVVHDANFVIDIHNPVGGGQSETDGCPHSVDHYDIPMRCLQPEGIEQLIITGRCISGTHRAHASYRVMKIAMALGQASAAIALSSIQTKVPVSKVDYQDVQKRLVEMGCDLFSSRADEN